MKSKFVAVLILLSLLTITFAIAIHVVPVKAVNENVKVYIDPPSVSKVPGDVNSFFDVFVTIDGVTDLFGFDIRVSWDNTLLTLESTVKDTYFDAIWGANPNHWEIALEGAYDGGGGGGGGYKLVALSTSAGFTKDPGAQVIFAMHFKIIKSCNFILETPFTFDLVKLSDHNYTPIPHTTTNGLYDMDKTIPNLEFKLVEPILTKPFEYCKTFEVEVYATHICAQLTDYDLTILYDAALLKFVDVDVWGVFGPGSYSSTAGSVHVWQPSPGTPITGEEILLFTLTFHVEFNDDPEHIWNAKNSNVLQAHVSVDGSVGDFSFVEGTIPITGIALPTTPLTLDIHLIKGDVTCDGKVDIGDLRTIASLYDYTGTSKYDLTGDGTIDIFDLVVVATNFLYGY